MSNENPMIIDAAVTHFTNDRPDAGLSISFHLVSVGPNLVAVNAKARSGSHSFDAIRLSDNSNPSGVIAAIDDATIDAIARLSAALDGVIQRSVFAQRPQEQAQQPQQAQQQQYSQQTQQAQQVISQGYQQQGGQYGQQQPRIQHDPAGPPSQKQADYLASLVGDRSMGLHSVADLAAHALNIRGGTPLTKRDAGALIEGILANRYDAYLQSPATEPVF